MKSTTSNELPSVYLARHGETAWSLTGQHTGITDLPLTERGEQNARALGERLVGLNFGKVFTSPLKRAVRTCELAGFGAVAEFAGYRHHHRLLGRCRDGDRAYRARTGQLHRGSDRLDRIHL